MTPHWSETLLRLPPWPVIVDLSLLALRDAAVAIATYYAIWLSYRWISNRFKYGAASETAQATLVARVVARTPRFMLAAAAAAITITVFGAWTDWLRALFLAALLVQFGLWGSALIEALLARYALRRAATHKGFANAYSLVRVLTETFLWSVIAIVVLSNFGINVTAMIAGLGIGGIAIGLAAQGLFADLFGSLAIVFDKPFVQGDFIVFGDKSGMIEHVGIKSTRIRALSGEQIVLSNTNLLGSVIHNYQRLRERRVVFGFGVTYQTPYVRVREIAGIVKSVIEDTDCTRFDRCHFKALGDSALLFEAVYHVLSADYGRYIDTQQKINLEIMRRFEQRNVSFAYQTQTVFFASSPQSDANSGAPLN